VIVLAHVCFMLHEKYFPVILSSVTIVLNKLLPQSHFYYVNISFFFKVGYHWRANAVHLQPYALRKKSPSNDKSVLDTICDFYHLCGI